MTTEAFDSACNASHQLYNFEKSVVTPKFYYLTKTSRLILGNMMFYRPIFKLDGVEIVSPCNITQNDDYVLVKHRINFNFRVSLKCVIRILGGNEGCSPSSIEHNNVTMITYHKIRKSDRRLFVWAREKDYDDKIVGLPGLVAFASREFVATVSASHLGNFPFDGLNLRLNYIPQSLLSQITISVSTNNKITPAIGQQLLDYIHTASQEKSVVKPLYVLSSIKLTDTNVNFTRFAFESASVVQTSQVFVITANFTWSSNASCEVTANLNGTFAQIPEQLDLVRESVHTKAVFIIVKSTGLIRARSAVKLSGTNKITANPELIEKVLEYKLEAYATKLSVHGWFLWLNYKKPEVPTSIYDNLVSNL